MAHTLLSAYLVTFIVILDLSASVVGSRAQWKQQTSLVRYPRRRLEESFSEGLSNGLDGGYAAADSKGYSPSSYDLSLCPGFGLPGGAGRGALDSDHPLAGGILSANQGVHSLSSSDVFLGQVLVFGHKVQPLQDNPTPILLTYVHGTKQKGGGAYGYNKTLGAMCAYVDHGEHDIVNGWTARVQHFSTRHGSDGDSFLVDVTLEGLRGGDVVFLKYWVVLKSDPSEDTTQVESRVQSAAWQSADQGALMLPVDQQPVIIDPKHGPIATLPQLAATAASITARGLVPADSTQIPPGTVSPRPHTPPLNTAWQSCPQNCQCRCYLGDDFSDPLWGQYIVLPRSLERCPPLCQCSCQTPTTSRGASTSLSLRRSVALASPPAHCPSPSMCICPEENAVVRGPYYHIRSSDHLPGGLCSPSCVCVLPGSYQGP